ncbi:10441_t:CDS:2, partial [Acaulospora morrowiae]
NRTPTCHPRRPFRKRFKDRESTPYVSNLRDHDVRKERPIRKKLRLEAYQPRTKREAFEKAKEGPRTEEKGSDESELVSEPAASEETIKLSTMFISYEIEDIGVLSDRVRVKELESSERDINAVEAGKEPGKDDKLVTLEQVKECHYGRKRDDQREDEPRSTWYGTTLASKEHDDEMWKSQGDLVVTEIRFERANARGVMSETSGSRESNRVDGGPTIRILDKCENRLDSHDKIVPVNTIEPIKKKEEEPDRYCNDDDDTILAKRDVHLSEKNRVMLVLTSDITIANCDDPGERSKKENEELVINGTRYWNTDRLTMKRPKANRVGLRYYNEEWITIYKRDAHPSEGKMEYETEGVTMFISMWELWDPEDSRNDDITEEEFTNDDKLADQDHWWERYYGKKDTTVGMPINYQDDEDKVVLIPTSVITIISCDDPGGLKKKVNRELTIGDRKYGDAHGLTDGRPDASGGGLGCHEDGGTITNDLADENKMEDEMKEGMVAPEYEKWWQWTNTLKELRIAYIDIIAKLIHSTMMIIVITVRIINGTVLKSECAGIMRCIGSISRKVGWCTEGWRERECEKRTQ